MLIFLLLVAPTQSTRIDRVIAVVEQEVVTEAELVLEARLALARRGAIASASKPIDPRILDGFLDYVVNQLLISSQARRLGSVSVSDEEVEREFDRFSDRFASRTAFETFLQRFDISEERVRGILLRDLRNGRYISRRMNVRLMGRPVSPNSKEYQDALALWLSELRDAATVRLLGPDGKLSVRDLE